MGNATLILIFSGLIAFVPSEARRPEFMTAYLLPGGGNHDARLRVLLSSMLDEAQCSSGCSMVKERGEDYCDCPLNNVGITFDPIPEERRGYIRSNPFGMLPDDDNALHLSWLVRLANVGGTDTPGGQELERRSVANVPFGWVSATTCAFDEEKESVARRKVYTFDFERGDPERPRHTQAVAELVVFRGNLASRRLKIRIVSRSGARSKELDLTCSGGICPVAISNRARTYPVCNRCEDCRVGDHFAYYYSLLADPPAYRPIPYRRCGAGEQVRVQAAPAAICPNLGQLPAGGREIALWESLLAAELEEVTAVSNRVICPMAILDP